MNDKQLLALQVAKYVKNVALAGLATGLTDIVFIAANTEVSEYWC